MCANCYEGRLIGHARLAIVQSAVLVLSILPAGIDNCLALSCETETK